MTDSNQTSLAQAVADILYGAWPCYVHYLDPSHATCLAEAPGFQGAAHLLSRLEAIGPVADLGYDPHKLPPTARVTADMVRGHEHHPACLALAVALTRSIPAVYRSVAEGRWDHPAASTGAEALRHAIAEAYENDDQRGAEHDPAHHTMTVAALTQLEERPIAAGLEWTYMVRLTLHCGIGDVLNAVGYMPMRCFTDLDSARNWALTLCLRECQLCDELHRLGEDRYQAMVREIAEFDGSVGTWRHPTMGTMVRITSAAAPWKENHGYLNS